jgi:hypothetical protein
LHGIFWIGSILLLLEVYQSDGAWLARPRNAAMLGLAVLLSMFFRHNGLLELVPTLLFAALVYRHYRRQLLVIFAAVLVAYYGSIALVSSVVRVDRGFSGFIIEMQFIYRSTIHQGYSLDDDTQAFLSYFPNDTREDMADHYHSVRSGEPNAKQDLYSFQRYNAEFIPLSGTRQLVTRLAEDVWRNPLPLLVHIYYTSRTMWVPVTPAVNGDAMAGPTSKTNLYGMLPYVEKYRELHAVDSRFPAALGWIDRFTNQNIILQELIWRPGLYSLLAIFGTGVSWIRAKYNLRALAVWLPGLIHFALFAVFHLWSYGYRYHWGMIAATFLLLASLLRVSPAENRAGKRVKIQVEPDRIAVEERAQGDDIGS